MNDTVIETRSIIKILGTGAAQVTALNNIDFALPRGTLTVLMGPSGSGKTTFLSVLGCMLTPTHGTVRVCGQSTSGADPETLARIRREHIGFVFQSFHLFPTLTAHENVLLALDLRDARGPQAAAKSDAVLEQVGLTQKRMAFPRELSGGEQQRVAIARALVADPTAILADEPTAALDSTNGHAIMALLADAAKERDRGVLVVTHDPRLLAFADRVVHIEDGRITGEKSPQARRQMRRAQK
jgi:putative ABC transport system ATP-binding protein